MEMRCIHINKFWCKVGQWIEAPDSYKLTNGFYIYKYFKNLGWADKPICAMIGNMENECGMNPGQEERASWSSGRGLVQWTPGTKLKNYTDSINKNWWDWQAQCSRIQYEMTHKLQWYATPYYRGSFKQFAHDKKSDIIYLTRAFTACYERPNMNKVDMQRRYNFAKKMFDYIKHHAPDDIDVDDFDYEDTDTTGGDDAPDRTDPYYINMTGTKGQKKFNYILYGGKKDGYNNSN